MPVPQEKLSFVERASCPFLRMVQDVSCIGIVQMSKQSTVNSQQSTVNSQQSTLMRNTPRF
ncbi:hypothetical protein QUA35_24360 [Microcoleus sp. N9_B2]|uniref:hypothetical protein n=1 Tax=unclassified Microcoleus TaxID=2642155 RepID=UPI002FD19087